MPVSDARIKGGWCRVARTSPPSLPARASRPVRAPLFLPPHHIPPTPTCPRPAGGAGHFAAATEARPRNPGPLNCSPSGWLLDQLTCKTGASVSAAGPTGGGSAGTCYAARSRPRCVFIWGNGNEGRTKAPRGRRPGRAAGCAGGEAPGGREVGTSGLQAPPSLRWPPASSGIKGFLITGPGAGEGDPYCC